MGNPNNAVRLEFSQCNAPWAEPHSFHHLATVLTFPYKYNPTSLET